MPLAFGLSMPGVLVGAFIGIVFSGGIIHDPNVPALLFTAFIVNGWLHGKLANWWYRRRA